MKQIVKKIPRFKNEDQERDFWAKHDTADYFDTSKPVKLDLSNLQRSVKSITLRMPESLISELKMLANKKDVPYQSLIKVYLAEKVKEELYK